MSVRIQRIELDEYKHVKAIEFYIESDPLQVLEFLKEYHLGTEFASLGNMPLEPPTKYPDGGISEYAKNLANRMGET